VIWIGRHVAHAQFLKVSFFRLTYFGREIFLCARDFFGLCCLLAQLFESVICILFVMSKRKLPTSYSTLRRQVRAQVDADLRSLAGHDNSSSSSDDEFSDSMANTVVMQTVCTGVNSDGNYIDGDYSDDRSHHLESHASESANHD